MRACSYSENTKRKSHSGHLENMSCLLHFITRYQGACLDMKCPAGKLLTPGGANCSSAVPQVTGMGYTLRLAVTALLNTHILQRTGVFQDIFDEFLVLVSYLPIAIAILVSFILLSTFIVISYLM